eukprot:s3317_g11.t1
MIVHQDSDPRKPELRAATAACDSWCQAGSTSACDQVVSIGHRLMAQDDGSPSQAPSSWLELVVDRHRSFGRQMAFVLFQDAPERCSAEDLEALKKQLPTSRALALGKKDFLVSCWIVARAPRTCEKSKAPLFLFTEGKTQTIKTTFLCDQASTPEENNKDDGGPPVYQAPFQSARYSTDVETTSNDNLCGASAAAWSLSFEQK